MPDNSDRIARSVTREMRHGKITCFLTSELFDGKILWKKVKKAVRAFEQKEK
jgi:hypothetical protein